MRGWLIALSLLCACEAQPPVASPVPTPEPASVHDVALETLEREAERATLVAESNGRSAIVYTRAASANMALARLGARSEHFVDAQRLLEHAYALSPGAPPRVQMARLLAALHRPKAAMAELDAFEDTETETPRARAFRLALKAQLAHELGAYDRAQSLIQASLQTAETATGWATLARDRWLRADFDGALEAYRRTEAAYGPANRESRAWVKLQVGLMALERGRLADAKTAYRAADAIYPGYWLVQEHLAEVLALQGHADQAKAIYEDVLSRVDVPALHWALADLCRCQGDAECADEATSRANRSRARWRSLFPAMVDGHDVRRSIESHDPEALSRALANVEARPNAEAWVLLARTQLQAGDPKGASESIQRALDMPVRSRELHETAAEVFETLGDDTRAAIHRDAASVISPTQDIEGRSIFVAGSSE